MASNTQHDDFGKKIGGAKKDLWSKRGLFSSDLLEMNSREADKYVKKDNVWKKPDYIQMINDGTPSDVAYYIKTVRDSIDVSPKYHYTDDTLEKRLARQSEYVDTVREIKAAMENLNSKEDVMKFFDSFMIAKGYYEYLRPGSGSYASPTQKGRENLTITDKLTKAMFMRSEYVYKVDIVDKSKREQFGISKEQKVPKGFRIQFNDVGSSSKEEGNWKPNTYYVTKNYRAVKINFENYDSALKWAQESAKQRGSNGKKRFVPEQLKHIRRTGIDYRKGKEIEGQDYLDTFGFRGGEFGNWMTQNDRQESLNMGFDALKDLAYALKIDDKDISYQGSLAIAFGARGSGNAMAHYELALEVINLTKMRGAGSLAHEWWHGLDDFLGKKMGVKGLLSESPYNYKLFEKLINTIKYKPETLEQATKRTEGCDDRTKNSASLTLDNYVQYSLRRVGNEQALTEYDKLKTAFLNGEIGSVDKLNALKKSVTKHGIPKKERDFLFTYERILRGMKENPTEEVKIGRVETDFYKNSQKMGERNKKDGGYWESNTEMTARAFAVYIKDKLQVHSDYLIGHAESAVDFDFDKDGKVTGVIKAYPEGEERKAINAVFDEIIADLKLQKYFIHDEHISAIKEAPLQKETLKMNSNKSHEQLSFFSTGHPPSDIEKTSVLDALKITKTRVAPPTLKTESKKTIDVEH